MSAIERDAEPNFAMAARDSPHASTDLSSPPPTELHSDTIEVQAPSPPSPQEQVSWAAHESANIAPIDTPTLLHEAKSSSVQDAAIPDSASNMPTAPTAHAAKEATDASTDAVSRLDFPMAPPTSSTGPLPTINATNAPSSIHSAPASQQASTSSVPAAPQGYYSTIKMNISSQSSATGGGLTGPSRRVKQYQLDDGSVVSGKGLGRGRPGIKRGPRTAKSSDSTSPIPTLGSVAGSSVNTPTTINNPNKRRRTLSDANKIKAETPGSDSMLSESRSSTPEYNPTDETRSGRKIQKPPTVHAVVPESASPASKRPKLENRPTSSTVSPVVKTHPKIKRRLYRGREQLALCEHCQRGHGPASNAIVFCDACNKCWHQRCHEPQVPASVVNDAKAEWFCVSCEKILHGKKGKRTIKGEASSSTTQPQPQFMGPLVGGASLTQAHKIAFLESRTKEQLISLILQGCDLAPALPMFQAPAPQLPQAQFKSNYTTPVSSTPGFQTAAAAAEVDDEGYDSYFDDHAALYPKPGHGVRLPPESTDLHMLLEHPQSRTFSHWIRGMPTREFSGNADIVFQR